jgi:hypothetical protein
LQIASYKPGKCWSDFERAVTDDVGGGSFTCDSQFAILAKRIKEEDLATRKLLREQAKEWLNR